MKVKKCFEKDKLFSDLYMFLLKHDKRLRFVYRYFCKKNFVIYTEVNNQRVWMPFSHMLPYYQKKYKNYDRQLGKICSVISKKERRQIYIIDIGANIGDTIINIGLHDALYLAVEGDRDYSRLLQKNMEDLKYNAMIENVVLSDVNEEIREYTMCKNRGTALLVKEEIATPIESTTLDKLMVEKYSEFCADIIKIDTDGFDYRIMRGAKNYIEKEHPLLFFEWSWREWEENGEDLLEVFTFLQALGYRDLLLYDNYGNVLLSLGIREIEKLRYLLNYSKNTDERIYYYDVLAIPKESSYSITEFLH